MAIFRNVNMSFWTDTKVIDDYTPEDRYFMLYALTNNYTNIIGCYEISIKQMSNDLGYNKDVVENLLKRFKEIHKTIEYDFDTKELMVMNWHKYNWSSSPKLDIPLYTAIENVKCDRFHDILAKIYNERESVNENNDMVSIPYRYSIDTTISITNTITNTINKRKKYFSNENLNEIFDEFLQMRKKIKAVNSDRAINTIINKLNKYDDDTKYKMIENSIVNSWKDVYELKQNKKIVPNWIDKKITNEKYEKIDLLAELEKE